ncbi:MAG TPA: hypothetical protein VD928_03540 [Candidatus Paceibacterota bacterium]|nr:hypothetical protein [Candidatus Paceibacterota bacterium]
MKLIVRRCGRQLGEYFTKVGLGVALLLGAGALVLYLGMWGIWVYQYFDPAWSMVIYILIVALTVSKLRKQARKFKEKQKAHEDQIDRLYATYH